jgi:hypothetical protein
MMASGTHDLDEERLNGLSFDVVVRGHGPIAVLEGDERERFPLSVSRHAEIHLMN